MALNFTTYTSQLANLLVISSNDVNFQTFQPGCIDYAEQRLYRELDLLFTLIDDQTGVLSSGVQTFSISTSIGTFITVDAINVITPVGLLPTTGGTRNPLVPVSYEFIFNNYPTAVSAATGVPEYFAMRSNTLVTLGPAPDAGYSVEVVGVQRPAPLSAANSSTILTQYVPDLFMAASLVFGFGYMRDFGGQSDNPQGSQSWEAQYQLLVKSAAVEQFRAKQEAQGWTSKIPSPMVQRS